MRDMLNHAKGQIAAVIVVALLVLIGIFAGIGSEEPPTTTSVIAAPEMITTEPTTTASTSTTTNSLPPPVDPSTIEGQWNFSDQPTYFTFDPDGTWNFVYYSDTPEIFDFGTYTFDGRTLTIRSSEEAVLSPCTSQTGWYDIGFVDDEHLYMIRIADRCARRGGDLRGQELERVPSP